MSPSTSAGRSWQPVNVTLLAVLALACLVFLTLLVAGAAVLPGTTPANRAEQRYEAVTTAAAAQAKAFLSVDYRTMDALQAKVLAEATGSFKQQYAATKSNLKASAKATKAVAVPRIRQVAIGKLANRRATVFVAADEVRTNINTTKLKATRACPHKGATCLYFRFKLAMTETAGGWKLSGVDFIS